MGHIPHLLIPAPWEGPRIEIGGGQADHLRRVLRHRPGEPVTYTDGAGEIGSGIYDDAVMRGQEVSSPRPSDLVVVAAPPASKDRLRFMVEKLAELGVAELRFLSTIRGQGRVPAESKLKEWAVSALEQSGGSWLMRTSVPSVGLDRIEEPYVICDRGGDPGRPRARTIVIGPEGGWDESEIPVGVPRFGLGDTTLRVETAAVVAAARIL
jgi:16S rRNA (uracil1498-N3)-methyltransferase